MNAGLWAYPDRRRRHRVDPKDRDVAMVFQNFARLPRHMTWREHRQASRLKVVRSANRDLTRCFTCSSDLQSYLDRKPKDLLGGQRRQVAMGRAIVGARYSMDEDRCPILTPNFAGKPRNPDRRYNGNWVDATVYMSLTTRSGPLTMGDASRCCLTVCAATVSSPPRALHSPNERVRRGVHQFPGDEPVQAFPRADSTVSLGDWRCRDTRSSVKQPRSYQVFAPNIWKLGGAGIQMDVDMVRTWSGRLPLWPNRVGRLRNGPVNRRSVDAAAPSRVVAMRLCPAGTFAVPSSGRRFRLTWRW